MADAKISVDNSVTKFKSRQPNDPIGKIIAFTLITLWTIWTVGPKDLQRFLEIF